MPLLARLDPRLDPTSPLTPIPKGNQNDTVTQERLQEIKTEILVYLIPSNWSRSLARSRALFKPCIPSDSAILNDDAIRKLWIGRLRSGVNLA